MNLLNGENAWKPENGMHSRLVLEVLFVHMQFYHSSDRLYENELECQSTLYIETDIVKNDID